MPNLIKKTILIQNNSDGVFRNFFAIQAVSSSAVTDILYRQINNGYRDSYGHLIESELYDTLVSAEMIVAHQNATITHPQLVPFTPHIG